MALLATALLLASGASAGASDKGFKRTASVVEVVETVTATQKSAGSAKKSSGRADAAVSEGPPTRPDKIDQPVADAVSVAGANTSSTTGRKLLALGDRCAVTLKNACRSGKAFTAAFGYFTWNGVGGQSGWVSEGTWTIRYGRSLRFIGQQTLFFATNSGLRPTKTATRPATFCVASSPYTIFLGDVTDYYYKINDATNRVTQYGYYCYQIGGYLRGGFYSPTYCGLTFTFSAC